LLTKAVSKLSYNRLYLVKNGCYVQADKISHGQKQCLQAPEVLSD
jgi:hypothetical protein